MPGGTLDFVGSPAGLAWLVGATPTERERALREVAHGAPEALDRVRADHAWA